MTWPAYIALLFGAYWLFGGTYWLLRNRSYRLRQIPSFLGDLLGFPVEFAQYIWGRKGVPYAFLMPNILIFGIFTFVPMVLNFWVSLTSGDSIKIFDRPFVGWSNYADIFNCESFFEPSSCSNSGFDFWSATFNTTFFVVLQVPALCAVSLVTALVLNRAIAGRGLWRGLFFYPVMLSPVVIANIWIWVLHRRGILNEIVKGGASNMTELSSKVGFDAMVTVIVAFLLILAGDKTRRSGRHPSILWTSVFGAVAMLVFFWSNPLAMVGVEVAALDTAIGLALFGLPVALAMRDSRYLRVAIYVIGAMTAILLLTIQFNVVFDFGRVRSNNWLVNPNTGWPFFWIVFVYCWAHMGFYMLILLAGLQSIPHDLYEAAEMDAAPPIRVFFRITLPLLMPTLAIVVVLCLIKSFQIFDEVYLLTGGGPGRETFMLVQHIYEDAFLTDPPDFGVASASSVLMGIVIAFFAFLQLYITRRQARL